MQLLWCLLTGWKLPDCALATRSSQAGRTTIGVAVEQLQHDHQHDRSLTAASASSTLNTRVGAPALLLNVRGGALRTSLALMRHWKQYTGGTAAQKRVANPCLQHS